MNNHQHKYVEITSTVPTEQLAKQMATAIIERQLAACVQVSSPLTSVYRWQGTIETANEFRLTAKTTVAASQTLIAVILDLHPYDVPEVLALPIIAGNADYLAWIEEQVSA